jgi:4,5-DOPA dioxygenase extradiol
LFEKRKYKDMRLFKDLVSEGGSEGSGVKSASKMPVLFIGHGSPMNAIEDNEFSLGWREMGKRLPRPVSILCVSAHWETRGTMVTAMERPRTIHDFGGFPKRLYEVQYPAPGDPVLAVETRQTVRNKVIELDEKWGLDHGAWSVMRRLYPEADVPVVQLSLDHYMKPQDHYDLAKELSALRRKGVLIIGSGNMVHNLGLVSWDNIDTPGFGFDWAVEANDRMKRMIIDGDHQSLINYSSQGKAFSLAIPTAEHFLPLLYALALRESDDEIELFNDRHIAGSLSMTSVRIG